MAGHWLLTFQVIENKYNLAYGQVVMEMPTNSVSGSKDLVFMAFIED